VPDPSWHAAHGRVRDRGPFETKAVELVQAAREVDALLGDIAQAQDRIAGAKPKLPAAVKGWQTTLEQITATDPRSMLVPLTHSSNGNAEAADTE